MKPANFPERKRQRQITALTMLSEPLRQAGESLAQFATRPDVVEWRALKAAVAAGSQRSVRTKKARTFGAFSRA